MLPLTRGHCLCIFPKKVYIIYKIYYNYNQFKNITRRFVLCPALIPAGNVCALVLGLKSERPLINENSCLINFRAGDGGGAKIVLRVISRGMIQLR